MSWITKLLKKEKENDYIELDPAVGLTPIDSYDDGNLLELAVRLGVKANWEIYAMLNKESKDISIVLEDIKKIFGYILAKVGFDEPLRFLSYSEDNGLVCFNCCNSSESYKISFFDENNFSIKDSKGNECNYYYEMSGNDIDVQLKGTTIVKPGTDETYYEKKTSNGDLFLLSNDNYTLRIWADGKNQLNSGDLLTKWLDLKLDEDTRIEDIYFQLGIDDPSSFDILKISIVPKKSTDLDNNLLANQTINYIYGRLESFQIIVDEFNVRLTPSNNQIIGNGLSATKKHDSFNLKKDYLRTALTAEDLYGIADILTEASSRMDIFKGMIEEKTISSIK